MTRPYLTDSNPMDNGYLDNDIPGFVKWFFIAITLWGVIFSFYYIFGGYDSERRFMEARETRTVHSASGR